MDKSTVIEDVILPESELATFRDSTVGASTIVEPNIVNVLPTISESPKNPKGLTAIEQVKSVLEVGSIKDSEETTGENKTYVGGGTTPDSSIVVDKPKRNYLIIGITAVVGAYVIYKVFLNKK